MINYPNIMKLIDSKLREMEMCLEYNRERVAELEAQIKAYEGSVTVAEREEFFRDVGEACHALQ